MTRYFREILALLGNDRRKLPWIALMFLLSSLLDLAGLGLIMMYFHLVMGLPLPNSASLPDVAHEILEKLNREQLVIAVGVILLVVFLSKTLLGIWTNRSILKFSMSQQTRLRDKLMTAYQAMPYTEYLERNKAEYVHSIHALTQHYASSVLTPLLRLVGEGIVACAILLFLASKSYLAVSLMVCIFGSFLGIYHWIFRKRLRAYGQQVNIASRRVVKSINESIEGFKEVRILGKEAYFHSIVHSASAQHAEKFVKAQIVTMAPRYLLELLMIIFVVVLVANTLAMNQSLAVLGPLLAMFGVAALRLLPMINSFSNSVLQLRFYRHSVSQLYADLAHASSYSESAKTRPQRSGERSPASAFQTLTLENICFRYPNATGPALTDISLEIKAGEFIGLIGTSGSGKTTLVDVFLGLLQPTDGRISYNGQPLSEHLTTWRNQVAYLPQQTFLLDENLRRNVALGEDENQIDENRLMAALVGAKLDHHVRMMAKGVDTQLGEHGIRLSGGQRQRIAIARAFYFNRDVLVLDEATSALDNETEHEIVDAMLGLKGKKTMIVIAHRLSTVGNCDRIYRLNQGRIVDVGPPETML